MIVARCNSRLVAETLRDALMGSWRVTYLPEFEPYSYAVVGHA